MQIHQLLIFLLIVGFLPIAQAENIVKPVISFSETVKESNDNTKPLNLTLARNTRPKVEIYYAAWYPHSQQAIKFFRKHHIVVKAYDINLDEEAAARKRKLAPDFNGIPLVIINGILIRGVDEQKYQNALWPIKPPR